MYWQDFISLSVLHFFALVTPGIDFAIVTRQSITKGRKTGIITALGIGAGIAVHVFYSIVGIAALMKTAPILLTIAKIIGGLYLLYLSYLFISAKPSDGSIPENPEKVGNAFWIGFITNATNPKATLFFLSIFTLFITETTPFYIQTLYGIWLCILTALWFTIVSLLFTHKSVQQYFVKKSYLIERAIGVLLIFFALSLLWEITTLFVTK